MPRCTPTVVLLVNAPAVVPPAAATGLAVPPWSAFLRLTTPPPPVNLVPAPNLGASTGWRAGVDPASSTASQSWIGA